MKNYIKKPILFLLVCLANTSFFSCQKELEFEKPKASQDLIIDGWIEQDRYARVFLTKSAAYFDQIDSAKMVNLVVRFAKVTISDGQNTEVLTLKRDTAYFPPYYYQSTDIKGEIGKKYKLTVELSGKTYSSSTTITDPVNIENVSFSPAEGSLDKGFLKIQYQDPLGSNYYRLYTQRIGKDQDFNPVYFPTYHDGIFDGKKMTIQLVRGAKSNTEAEKNLFYEKGDSVMIKLTTIDKESYNFWRVADSRIYTSSNPFAISTNELIGNVENGLGIWSGYGTSYFLFVVK